MKYIRTKDGIYKVRNRLPEEYFWENSFYVYNHEHIEYQYVINQASTIKELIDEFVCVIPNKEKPYLLDKNTNLKLQVKYIGDVFGAIWTDKGLIYVAKMNDKGELELL